MYSAVPSTISAAVVAPSPAVLPEPAAGVRRDGSASPRAVSIMRASPKSSTFTTSPAANPMLLGLMSRCKIPAP